MFIRGRGLHTSLEFGIFPRGMGHFLCLCGTIPACPSQMKSEKRGGTIKRIRISFWFPCWTIINYGSYINGFRAKGGTSGRRRLTILRAPTLKPNPKEGGCKMSAGSQKDTLFFFLGGELPEFAEPTSTQSVHLPEGTCPTRELPFNWASKAQNGALLCFLESPPRTHLLLFSVRDLGPELSNSGASTARFKELL